MPVATVGCFGAVAGGQNPAHVPLQRLLSFLSCPNAYSVRPLLSTRILPRPVFLSLSVGDFALAALVFDATAATVPPATIATSRAAREMRSVRVMSGNTCARAVGFGEAVSGCNGFLQLKSAGRCDGGCRDVRQR